MKAKKSLLSFKQIAALTLFSGVILMTPLLVKAESCPDAKEVADHAIKEGIGAQWQTANKLSWYLDYFSNNKKPAATASEKFTFIQSLMDGQQLTCYYEWPDDAGQTTNWMTVRLKSTHKIKPNWEGTICKNFEAANCAFTILEGNAADAAPATTSTTTTTTTQQAPTTDATKK